LPHSLVIEEEYAVITVHDPEAASVCNAVVDHLAKGGTNIAGQLLAKAFLDECNQAATASARKNEIRNAVEASKVGGASGAGHKEPVLPGDKMCGEGEEAVQPIKPVHRKNTRA
jgi:hypothetical protein